MNFWYWTSLAVLLYLQWSGLVLQSLDCSPQLALARVYQRAFCHRERTTEDRPPARPPDPSKTQWAKTLFPQWSGCVDYPPSVDFWAFWEPWGLSRLPPCALQPPRASFSRSTNFMYSPIDINTTLRGKDSIVFHCLASSSLCILIPKHSTILASLSLLLFFSPYKFFFILSTHCEESSVCIKLCQRARSPPGPQPEA